MSDYMSDYETYQLIDSMSGGASATAAGASIWGIISLILAVVGGVLIYFLFIRSKSPVKGKFLKWLKDFLSFKVMWIEPILKVAYYSATIFVMLVSFSFLGIGGGYGFLAFLICLIIVPIIIRLFYEVTMMFIMIWRNTRDIAENFEKKPSKKD